MDETAKKKPTFESFADATLAKVRATYGQRGVEYADSWNIETFHSPFTDLVIQQNANTKSGLTNAGLKRLLAAAALCDVKLSRMSGGYKEDTLIDLIAYIAFLNSALNEVFGA